MRNTGLEAQAGIKIARRNINYLRYADDTTLMAESEEELKSLLKKVYSSAFGWKVLKISMRYISSNVSFQTCISLLIFYFDDLSIGVSGVLYGRK